jgi:hypothetical protein
MKKNLVKLIPTGAFLSQFEACYTGLAVVDDEYIKNRNAHDVDSDDIPDWSLDPRSAIRNSIPKTAKIYCYRSTDRLEWFAAI